MCLCMGGGGEIGEIFWMKVKVPPVIWGERGPKLTGAIELLVYGFTDTCIVR